MMNMTYVQAIDFALQALNENVFEGIEEEKSTAIERLEALKVQLSKRSSSKTPTKTQKENEGVKEKIVQVLVDSGKKMTVTEILGCDGMSGYTNQKISALLRQLVEANKVVKTLEGKKAYFSVEEE